MKFIDLNTQQVADYRGPSSPLARHGIIDLTGETQDQPSVLGRALTKPSLEDAMNSSMMKRLVKRASGRS